MNFPRINWRKKIPDGWRYIFVSLAIFAFTANIIYAVVSQAYRSNHGTSMTVESIRGSPGYNQWSISNYTVDKDVFIPNNTLAEWDAFELWCRAQLLPNFNCSLVGEPPGTNCFWVAYLFTDPATTCNSQPYCGSSCACGGTGKCQVDLGNGKCNHYNAQCEPNS